MIVVPTVYNNYWIVNMKKLMCVLLGYILLILPYVVQGNILKFNHMVILKFNHIVILKHYRVWSYASQ